MFCHPEKLSWHRGREQLQNHRGKRHPPGLLGVGKHALPLYWTLLGSLRQVGFLTLKTEVKINAPPLKKKGSKHINSSTKKKKKEEHIVTDSLCKNVYFIPAPLPRKK